jgi:2-desacetyl-2-hydroxyethyl bacteriochlorophyllide A dehydrogenase
MKALVVEGPRRAAIREVPYPAPKPGDITIQVKRTGICGTDFHIFEGEFISPYPIIPGHEFAGVVHEVGEGVTGFSVGDRVTADPSLFCGACRNCLTQRGNHCLNWGALGNTVNGSMAEYVAVPAANAVILPDHLSFEQAAFIEPVACVVHAMNRLQAKMGDRVILFGAGAMGQQLVQTLSRCGASELTVVDVSQAKLDLALKWGATRGVLSQEAADRLAGETFDIVIDATGIPAVIEQAFRYMGPAAKYLQFGVTPTDAVISLEPFRVYHRDWTILGSMAINHTFLPAFEWVKAGRIETAHLVSRVISLEEAVEFLQTPKDPDLMKVQIAVS